MWDKATTRSTPLPPIHSNTPLSHTIIPISNRTIINAPTRITKAGDQMDPVVIQQTRRQHSTLLTRLPSIIIIGEITAAAGTIDPHKIGEMAEIISNLIGVITVSTISNAKEARNKVSSSRINNMLTAMGTPSTRCTQRKHSNNQIDMKGPRESQQHTIQIFEIYQF